MLDAVVRQLMSCRTFCRNFVVTFVVTLSYDFLKIAFYRTFVVNLLYVVTLSYICRTTFCKLGSWPHKGLAFASKTTGLGLENANLQPIPGFPSHGFLSRATKSACFREILTFPEKFCSINQQNSTTTQQYPTNEV